MASHGFPSCVLNFLGIFSQNHLKTVKSFCVESLIGTSMFDQSCCCHVIGTARVGWRRGGLRWLERRACVRKNGWRELSRTSEQGGSPSPRPGLRWGSRSSTAHSARPRRAPRCTNTHKSERIQRRNSIHGGGRRAALVVAPHSTDVVADRAEAMLSSLLARRSLGHLVGRRRAPPRTRTHGAADIAKHSPHEGREFSGSLLF